MLELGVKFLLSYFLGSIMGAMLMGRLRGGVDIRTMGSGNAGGTNALRTQGFWFALGVIVVDIGKGIVGAALIPGLDLPWVGIDPTISRTWLTLCCAAAAVFGHVWPVYHRFRGGKGAATLIGTLLVVGPQLVPPMLLAWAVALTLSGYVGLATMFAAVCAPTWIGIFYLPEQQPLFIYTTVMAAYVIRWHRSNIQRMRAGTEHRNDKLMLLSRNRGAADDEQA
jgi:glycerol-3-phosphate acyltransferase PlsY